MDAPGHELIRDPHAFGNGVDASAGYGSQVAEDLCVRDLGIR